MFKFFDYDIPECVQINSPEGRRYQTPSGDLYPSVTTVLGSIPNTHLNEWIEKVGKEESQRIADAAARRGTKIHTWCENHLRSIDNSFSMFDQEAKQMFEHMIPELNKFQEVHALETRLWSDKLRVAGTVDSIAKIDGEMYVVDFKTSRSFKSREDIPSYFMQAAAYSVMWWERTGILINKSRILISTQDDGVLVYDEPVKPWLIRFLEVRKNFL